MQVIEKGERETEDGSQAKVAATVRSSDTDTDPLTVAADLFTDFRSKTIASSLQNGGFESIQSLN